MNEPAAREGSKNGASLPPKLALSAGSTAGAQRRGSMRACGGGDAYHYSFVAQANSGTGCKPIVVRASTNTGRPADLYRLLLPPHGGGGDASGGGGEERRKALPSGQLSKAR